MSLTRALKNKYQAVVTPQFTTEPPKGASPAEMANWHRWKKLFDAGKTELLYGEWNIKRKK